jgi:multisubunit Na+/H+ antiporter MnhC subunit
MKKITTSIILTAIVISLCACKSGKASCDAYGKVHTESISDQASK